jgi:hypothetical protein
MRKALAGISVALGLCSCPHLALAADVNMILVTWVGHGESTLPAAQTIVGTFTSMAICKGAASAAQVVNGQPELGYAFICVQSK